MFWWHLKTTVNGRQISQCVLYHKCSDTILHSSYNEREIKLVGVSYITYISSFSAIPTPLSHCEWRGPLINHLNTGPVRPWHLQTLLLLFFFCLLSHAAATLANQPWEVSIILMKIYRRLYLQTVNQLSRRHSSLPSVWAGVWHLTKAHLSSVGPWLFALPTSPRSSSE